MNCDKTKATYQHPIIRIYTSTDTRPPTIWGLCWNRTGPPVGRGGLPTIQSGRWVLVGWVLVGQTRRVRAALVVDMIPTTRRVGTVVVCYFVVVHDSTPGCRAESKGWPRGYRLCVPSAADDMI